MFLPMHIPVIICGFVIGSGPAIIVGFLAPILSHLLTSMPPTYAVPLMAMELPFYGIAAALAYRHFKLNIYLSLLIAMIIGRLVFAFGLFILGQFIALPYGPAQFFAVGGAVISGIPGIIFQFIIIPPLVLSLKRMRHYK